MATRGGNNNPRGRNGKFREDPETAEQDARVMDMWARGYTQGEIKAELGWNNNSSVSRAIDRAYASTVAPHVDAARKRSIERLDRAHRKAREIMDADHVLVSHGKVMRHPDTDAVLPDYGPNIAAIDRIVSIEKRLASVVGFDAPVKHSVDVIQRDAMHAEMEAMMAELEKNDATTADSDDGELVNAGGVDGSDDAG